MQTTFVFLRAPGGPDPLNDTIRRARPAEGDRRRAAAGYRRTAQEALLSTMLCPDA